MPLNKLDLKDRLILRNQFLLLAHLDEGGSEAWKRNVEILEHGYETDYPDLTQTFALPFSPSNSDFVVDVLDMFRAFHYAKEAGIQPDDEDALFFDFIGFDGNNELPYLLYAEFQIKPEGRWNCFKGKPLDAHMERLGRYQQLLTAWNECTDPQKVTKEDFSRIASAVKADSARTKD